MPSSYLDTPNPLSPQKSGGPSDAKETDSFDLETIKDTQLPKVGFYTKEFQWLGSPWTCKKKRRHYQAFCRNGFKISVNVFVHVLAEENNRLVAYLDDMYEDVRGSKMVVVRWFHKIDEVGLDLPLDFNDREIFFSLCLQDLSIECIDGLAMVLSPDHYEKFPSVAKHTKLEPYVCGRQFDNDDLKPFDVTQVKGYWKQDILKHMFSQSSSRPLDKSKVPDDSVRRDFDFDANGPKPRKRLRLARDYKMNIPPCSTMRDPMEIDDVNGERNLGASQGPRVTVSRMGMKVEAPRQSTAVGSVVEVLSQDSGMRGCWFRATVIKKHKNKLKLSYHDIKDAEDEANCLQEWVMASRIAVHDEMGLRIDGRTTIRPSFLSNEGKIPQAFNVGAVVDAWQYDGWWEGIVIQKKSGDTFRVYFPGEKREAVLGRSDLRQSQEWVENTWRKLSERPDNAASILAGMTCAYKQPEGDPRKTECSADLNENKKVVPDLSKDDFLSQLKWKTLGKRRRSCFSVQKLYPRGGRVNSERTLSHRTKHENLTHSTTKVRKEGSETSKVDREKCKYTNDSLFTPSVIPPPLTSLVMSR
ncbi:hypothetical protein RND81_11G059600 [Saponaria officinalis]|uniref:BAH domain-containing protein n=1 Tax=Saponaria officinalis TaxID=3572 RepID=A0AAW1HIN7_SAPOF